MFSKIMEIYIVFTRNCNLRCSYCYQNKVSKVIDFETLDKTVEFIEEHPKIRYINLFGGEAFLELDKIDYFINKLIALKNKTNREFMVYTNTNGTIYNDKFLNLIDKITYEFEFRYAISIDGNKNFHDSKRRTIDNKPTYDLIIDNIKKIRNHNKKIFIDFHTVIHKEMCKDFYSVAKDICRNPLFDWGAFEFLMKIDGKVHYTVKDMENIYSGIMRLNQEGYSLEFLNVRFNNIIKTLDYQYSNFLKEKEYCPNGTTQIAIDYNGKCYPCDFYLTLDEKEQEQYSIYDLKTKEIKSNAIRLKELIYDNDKQNEKCSKCLAKHFCYICTAVKDTNNICGLEIECQQNKIIYEALKNTKFKIQ